MQDPLPRRSSGGQGVGRGEERRGSARYPSSLESDCHPVAGDRTASWRGQVKDISASGVGLLLKRRFEPRTVLVIGLEHPEQGLARTLLARVVHATALTDGAWLVGCAFLRELTTEELQACAAERIRPSEPDCRAWVRVACDIDSFCRADGEGPAARWPVKVVNVAPTGFALLVTRNIPRGALLRAQLPAAEGQAAREVLVRVVQVHERPGGEWLLGCEVAEQLAENELQRLPG